jgi:predicted nuclease with TOPRIM domain
MNINHDGSINQLMHKLGKYQSLINHVDDKYNKQKYQMKINEYANKIRMIGGQRGGLTDADINLQVEQITDSIKLLSPAGLDTKYNALVATHNQLLEYLNNLGSEIDELIRKLQEVTRKERDCEERLRRLQAQYTTQSSAQSAQYAAQSSELKAAAANATQKDGELLAAKGTLQTLQTKFATLQQTSEEDKRRFAAAQRNVVAAQAAATGAHDRVTRLEAQLSGLQAQSAADQASHTSALAAAEARVVAASRELETARATDAITFANAKGEAEAANTALETLKRKHAASAIQRYRSRKDMGLKPDGITKEWKKLVKKLRDKINELQAENARLRQELADAQARLGSITTDDSKCNNKIAQILAQIDQAIGTVQSKQSSIRKLQQGNILEMVQKLIQRIKGAILGTTPNYDLPLYVSDIDETPQKETPIQKWFRNTVQNRPEFAKLRRLKPPKSGENCDQYANRYTNDPDLKYRILGLCDFYNTHINSSKDEFKKITNSMYSQESSEKKFRKKKRSQELLRRKKLQELPQPRSQPRSQLGPQPGKSSGLTPEQRKARILTVIPNQLQVSPAPTATTLSSSRLPSTSSPRQSFPQPQSPQKESTPYKKRQKAILDTIKESNNIGNNMNYIYFVRLYETKEDYISRNIGNNISDNNMHTLNISEKRNLLINIYDDIHTQIIDPYINSQQKTGGAITEDNMTDAENTPTTTDTENMSILSDSKQDEINKVALSTEVKKLLDKINQDKSNMMEPTIQSLQSSPLVPSTSSSQSSQSSQLYKFTQPIDIDIDNDQVNTPQTTPMTPMMSVKLSSKLRDTL